MLRDFRRFFSSIRAEEFHPISWSDLIKMEPSVHEQTNASTTKQSKAKQTKTQQSPSVRLFSSKWSSLLPFEVHPYLRSESAEIPWSSLNLIHLTSADHQLFKTVNLFEIDWKLAEKEQLQTNEIILVLRKSFEKTVKSISLNEIFQWLEPNERRPTPSIYWRVK